jgi:hypothetical protein
MTTAGRRPPRHGERTSCGCSTTRPASAHPDDQVARAIFEARGIGAAFFRLGREARPALAWRCEEVGKAVTAALHAYFEETE